MIRSQGCWGIFSKLAAILVALALVVLLPLMLIAQHAAEVLFEADLIAETLAEQVVDSGLFRASILENILGDRGTQESLDGGFGMQSILGGLTIDDLGQVTDTLIPQAWVRQQMINLVQDTYRWLEDDRRLPALSIDFVPIKSSLVSEAGIDLLELIVRSWPQCSTEDLIMMGLAGGSAPEEVAFPLCQPPEPYRTILMESAVADLELMASVLPPTISLLDERPEMAAAFSAAKQQLRFLRLLIRTSGLITISLLGLIMLLVVRSWRALGLWWGIPVTFGGLLTYVPLAVAGMTGEPVLRQAIVGANLLPYAVAEGVLAVALGLLNEIIAGLALRALPIWLGGLGLIAGGTLMGWLTGRRRQKPKQTSAATQPAAILDDPFAEVFDDTPSAGMYG